MKQKGIITILIKLAGIVFQIPVEQASTIIFDREFIVQNEKPSIIIEVNQDDLKQESVLLGYRKPSEIQNDLKVTPILERQVHYHKIIEQFSHYSIVLMHGVVISNGKEAYMFSAPSRTGKTTRACLFTKKYPEFFILNGDKPAIKVENDKLIACGTPWKGKEGLGCNAEIPLKAIFFLERSNETVVEQMCISEAFRLLISESYLPENPEAFVKTMHLLKSFGDKVSMYRFFSTPTAESVEVALQVANECIKRRL